MKASIIILTCSLFIASILTACGSISDNSTFNALQREKLAAHYAQHSCEDWGRVTAGPFIIENNVWNKGSRKNYTQCVFAENDTSPATMGWVWNWPYDSRGEVVAYPELIYGDKPWSDEMPSDTLPIPVTKRDILVSYNAELEADGVWNMAFSMWLTDALPPQEENLANEIMIWTANSGMRPAGTYRETVTLDGVDYKIYINHNHIPAQDGSAGGGWTYITFLSTQEQFSGTLNFGNFLGYLLENQTIRDGLYLADIELGNEIVNGRGEFTLSQFDISIP